LQEIITPPIASGVLTDPTTLANLGEAIKHVLKSS
jgi:hypothetical protein